MWLPHLYQPSGHAAPVPRRETRSRGRTLTDLNPIEQVFAKLKALLRAMAIRTIEALWKALGTITECVSPQECRNFFPHCGYFQ